MENVPFGDHPLRRMERIVASDFDEFVQSLTGLQGRYLLKTAQTKAWELSFAQLPGLTLAIGDEGGGRIYSGLADEKAFHYFFLRGACTSVTVDGRPFSSDHVAWIAPGNHFHTSTEAPISWLNITIDIGMTLRWATLFRGEFPETLINHSSIFRANDRSRYLEELVMRIMRAEIHSPKVLHSPLSEHHASNQVMRAISRALLPTQGHFSRQRGNWRRIVHRALDFIESSGTEVIDTGDMCNAAAASERTLRDAFNSYFGISPHRYLMTYRLHAIRSAIRRATHADTVADICARHGIWDFGRFSALYEQHFGELPSHALRSHRR